MKTVEHSLLAAYNKHESVIDHNIWSNGVAMYSVGEDDEDHGWQEYGLFMNRIDAYEFMLWLVKYEEAYSPEIRKTYAATRGETVWSK